MDEELKALLKLLEDPKLANEWKVITVSRELRNCMKKWGMLEQQ